MPAEMNDKEPPIGWLEVLGQWSGNPPNPRTCGELLFARGEEYVVSSCENRIKAQFEQWVRRNAKAEIRAIEQEDGPEEAASYRDAYLSAVNAKKYVWGGERVRKAFLSEHGFVYFLYLLLRRCRPNITEEEAKEVAKDAPQDCILCVRWALGNYKRPSQSADGEGRQNGTTTIPQQGVGTTKTMETMDG